MSMITKQVPIDPCDVPLNSLVAQEKEQVDVSFISRNNFNNNAYRSNFGNNNPRPFPSNNNNSYGHISNDRGMPSNERIIEIERATKNYMHTQYEQNKTFSRQLDEHSSILKNISKQLESLNSEISNLQARLTKRIEMDLEGG